MDREQNKTCNIAEQLAYMQKSEKNQAAVGEMLFKTAQDGELPAEVMRIMPPSVKDVLSRLSPALVKQIREIRLRLNRPLLLVLDDGDFLLDAAGAITVERDKAYYISARDLGQAVQLISDFSVYAFTEELKKGYITLRGGHRVGLSGKAVLEKSRIRTLKNISSLNIRMSRQLPGIADQLLPLLWDSKQKAVHHTLLISPPGCGKTTLLRDIIRQLSDGVPELTVSGQTVGLVDERSELAGCWQGVPQNDVGMRTDVLDGCPKAEGMLLLLRAMGPRIIAADELGSAEDLEALREVLNAGVRVVTTAHASSLAELRRRPLFKELLAEEIFSRLVILSREQGCGTIKQVLDPVSGQVINYPPAAGQAESGEPGNQTAWRRWTTVNYQARRGRDQ